MQDSVILYINNSNALNAHIEQLKSSYELIESTNQGHAVYSDHSLYNFRRINWANISNNATVYRCSANICRNAQQQPFVYFCKYFRVPVSKNSINNFESVLNNFLAVENGKNLLIAEKERIFQIVKNKTPFLLRTLRRKTFFKKLGFHNVDLSTVYFPVFSFQYVSTGGNSIMQTNIVFDTLTIERFISYLSSTLNYRESVEGQRSLMTYRKRELIKNRDKYTCQICGMKATSENNLLLEIDHIIPLSKGGDSSDENLQTLCWRCNRKKGSKILT